MLAIYLSSGYDEIIRVVFHADESENREKKRTKRKDERKKKKKERKKERAETKLTEPHDKSDSELQTGENASSTTHSKHTKKETIRISIRGSEEHDSLSLVVAQTSEYCHPRGNRTKIIPIVYDRSRIVRARIDVDEVDRVRGGIPLRGERERERDYLPIANKTRSGWWNAYPTGNTLEKPCR